jgi:sirohydrochlorin cobaltochelatase
MSIASQLHDLVRNGIRRIGEIEILTGLHDHAYVLCHYLDAERAADEGFGGLAVHTGAADARALSIHAADGSFRFIKAQVNLKRGWVLVLTDDEELRLALDHFYPAAVGLELARRKGVLEVEHLRDKLNRQTGMYRYARSISDEGAQQLVEQVCGPAHNCARRILWQLDADTPLADNEASRYNGIVGDLGESHAIPLLCREACNHFVAECRKAAKREFDAKQAGQGADG